MFTVILLDFAKKENSTKQPTGGGIAVQGVLKEPCSIANPRIRIERLANDASPSSYTYAYISTFGRYYFIRDWIWTDGLWEVDMEVDVLASFKTQIGNQSEYILRHDSTTDFNEHITDTMYPATNDFTISEYSMQSAFVNAIGNGCYIVGIISAGTGSNVGAISYYAMSASQFNALKTALFSDENLDVMGFIDTSTTPPTVLVQDISQELLKTLYNPYQYIVSCMWFPFPSSVLSGTQTNPVKIGWWEYSSVSGLLLNAQKVELGESGSLPSHPDASTRGAYLNYAPYTRRTIIGRFGTVALDTAYYKLGNNISIGYMVDTVTGQCKATIEIYGSGESPTHTIIAERNFLLGVPIQIAQVGTDYLGTAVSALNGVNRTVGSAVSGFFSGGVAGAITGTVASAMSGIYDTVQSAMPQVETSGTNGSFIAPFFHTYVLSQFFKLVDENIVHKGRPLCENRTISSLSGYVLCADGDIDISCFDTEKEKIRNFLVTGFFWE